jgi:hypothetical protein
MHLDIGDDLEPRCKGDADDLNGERNPASAQRESIPEARVDFRARDDVGRNVGTSRGTRSAEAARRTRGARGIKENEGDHGVTRSNKG